MKLVLTAITLSTAMVATSAMANKSIQTIQPQQELKQAVELSSIFEDSNLEKTQALELSTQEMKDTEGAFAPFIPVVVSVGSRFITNQFIQHQIRNGTLIYGTYNAAKNMNNR